MGTVLEYRGNFGGWYMQDTARLVQPETAVVGFNDAGHAAEGRCIVRENCSETRPAEENKSTLATDPDVSADRINGFDFPESEAIHRRIQADETISYGQESAVLE